MRKPNSNNNKQLVSGKDDPPTPSEVTTCASSVHTNLSNLEEQRLRLNAQTMRWGVAAGATVTTVTLTFVPIQLLVGLAMIITFLLGVMYTLYQRAQLEYQNIVTGRGLGEYLPEEMYDQLANVSFHDWMANGTFIQEHQHLMLYMIPGITTEQLNDYVDRLLPRHRRVLRRPGLGHFLGPQFMRLLMGDSRLAGQHQTPGLVPRRLELTEPAATDDHDDDASGLGLDEDPASQYVRFLGLEPETSAPPPVSTSRAAIMVDSSVGSHDDDHQHHDDDDDEDDEEEEEDLAANAGVMIDAIFGGARAVSGMASNMALSYARNTVSWAVGGVSRASLTLGIAGVGLGVLGVWAGVYQAPSNIQMPRISFPSQTVLISSTLASGATAGMMLMMFGFPGGKSDDKKKK